MNYTLWAKAQQMKTMIIRLISLFMILHMMNCMEHILFKIIILKKAYKKKLKLKKKLKIIFNQFEYL